MLGGLQKKVVGMFIYDALVPAESSVFLTMRNN